MSVEPEKAFGRAVEHAALVTQLLLLSGREDTEGVAALLHPDLRVLPIPGLAPGRGYQSREEFLQYFVEAREAGQHIQPDLVSLRVGPDGAILAECRLRVAGAGNEADVDAWFVYTFRDGLVASFSSHLDPMAAERAAGLAL